MPTLFRRLMPLLAVVPLLLSACSLQHNLDGQSGVGAADNGPQAPPIQATTLDGHAFDSRAASGHPMVVDFWASWCGPCRAQQGDLNALYREFSPRGVVFLGVDLRDNSAAATAYQRDLGVSYPSVGDESAQIASRFDVAAPPTTVVVDRQGRIVQRLLGTTVGMREALVTRLG